MERDRHSDICFVRDHSVLGYAWGHALLLYYLENDRYFLRFAFDFRVYGGGCCFISIPLTFSTH